MFHLKMDEKGILLNMLCYSFGMFVGFFSSNLVNPQSITNYLFSNSSPSQDTSIFSQNTSIGLINTTDYGQFADHVAYNEQKFQKLLQKLDKITGKENAFKEFAKFFEDQTSAPDTTTSQKATLEESKDINESKSNTSATTTTITTNNSSAAEKVIFQFDEVLDGLSQEDPRILDFIQKNHVYKPQLNKEYNLTFGKEFQNHGQVSIIQKILGNMTNGFFVDSGALDGERSSNTLPLEMNFGWTGLLIEPQPDEFQKILSKNRKTICLDVCLSPVNTPMKIQFIKPKNTERNDITRKGSMDDLQGAEKDLFVPVKYQCFPLWTILTAMNVTTIDYFSFDIEGSEMEILQNFPFDKVQIKTISMEKFWRMEREAMKTFMFTRGFDFVQEIGFDYIFVHQNLNYHQHQLTGSFKNAVSGLCIDTDSKGVPFFLGTSSCRNAHSKPLKNTFRVTFYLTKSGVMRYYEGGCWSVQDSGIIEVVHCYDTNFEQFDKWEYNSNKNLIHIKSGKCVMSDGRLKINNCTNGKDLKWDFSPKPRIHFN